MANIDREILKRNRRAAVILGIASGLALISMVYAFVQKGIADERMQEANVNAKAAFKNAKIVDSLRAQLSNCVEVARSQQQMSAFAMEQARLAQQRSEEALQKALKK